MTSTDFENCSLAQQHASTTIIITNKMYYARKPGWMRLIHSWKNHIVEFVNKHPIEACLYLAKQNSYSKHKTLRIDQDRHLFMKIGEMPSTLKRTLTTAPYTET